MRFSVAFSWLLLCLRVVQDNAEDPEVADLRRAILAQEVEKAQTTLDSIVLHVHSLDDEAYLQNLKPLAGRGHKTKKKAEPETSFSVDELVRYMQNTTQVNSTTGDTPTEGDGSAGVAVEGVRGSPDEVVVGAPGDVPMATSLAHRSTKTRKGVGRAGARQKRISEFCSRLLLAKSKDAFVQKYFGEWLTTSLNAFAEHHYPSSP